MVLAVRTPQLARIAEYPGGRADQLEVFAALGLFGSAGAPTSDVRFAALGDEAATLEQRARSYLASNCAHCHQPGGWQPPPMTLDLRFDRTLAETAMCGVELQFASPVSGAELRIAPGSHRDSNLWLRLVHEGPGRMPPLAVGIVDDEAVDVIGRWIDELGDCPP
jgi:hypothetical protein